MARNSWPHPIRSALVALFLWIGGRLQFPRDRIGDVVIAESGQQFTVYRETTIVEAGRRTNDGDAVVLVFRFHLRFMPDPIVPYAVRVFEPLSILTTPFFVGIPGFETNIWLFDHETGDYEGPYQWRTAEDATRYAEALTALMSVLSIPGSVSYEIVEETSLDEYVAAHSPAETRSGTWGKRALGGVATAGILGIIYWGVVRPRYLGWERQRKNVPVISPGTTSL